MAELNKSLAIASTVLSAGGSLYAGNKAKQAADDEAAQLRRRAGARRAEAQAAAAEDRRQTRLQQSRAQALVAAGGGALADPGIVNLMGDIETEGRYAALSRLYSGYEEAAGLDDAAAARQREGRAARKASRLQSVTSVLSGVETLRSKYG